ncbi:glycoside hydrolase family 28 protein [Schleiferilactobacillus perolens]|uniref:Glycoside hydrolase family 28 n=1 Tax=Schleiferilactobacillus perolens DSM 12744 TaxID=1423792 RepID=A0A0R1N817_9LACO|nr:right-handed parallel beta-helix repeat-containing protein [Schleiferilactobacillus perolens]KRL13810.1 hypothetical protein FD09_GL001840 [Schleiferilactobacillus perolens DSM 12744]
MTDSQFLITDYGAEAGRMAVQTEALQAALDACHQAGGGTVVIPAGRFITGSLRLFSHTTLHLLAGAVLQGSPDLADYTNFGETTDIRYLTDAHYIQDWHLPTYYFQALVNAYDAVDVAVIGEAGSLIDGRNVQDPHGEEHFRGPMGLVFARVQDVRLQGYTFINSANWANVLPACENVQIDNVTILGGHDGFDLHHAKDVTITGCRLETGDDCLAGYDIHGLSVRDTYLNTACNGLRVGGSDIVFDHCTFRGPGKFSHLSDHKYETLNVFMYFAMQVDPITTPTADVTIKNASIDHVSHLVTYLRSEPTALQDGPALQSFTLDNVQIADITDTSLFVGRGEAVALTMTNCQITPTADVPLLHIDESVRLTLTNVFFTKPTIILIGNDRQLTLTGLTNLAL